NMSTNATGSLTVTLSSPAGAAGQVIDLALDNASATAPVSVTVPAGATSVSFAVTSGPTSGTVPVTASATGVNGDTPPGYTPADATVTVTDALISIGFVPEFGPDETQGVPISLTKPAPPGGLTITLVTDDPSVATVSPTVTVPQGQFLPPANPQATGHTLGTTQVTASAPGFAPDHRGLIVALALSFTPTTLSLGAAETRDITLL